MTRLVIGVDPGVTGAWAALDASGALVAVEDLPVMRDHRLAWIDADALASRLIELRGGSDLIAFTERCHAMPLNGSRAAFAQGATLGSILATLQLVRARIELVSPAAWKQSCGLGPDKGQSLTRARMLFPLASLDRVKDHNRAEALLLADWGLRRSRAGVAA